MYLFTRQVLVSSAHVRAGMAHATSMARYVNEKTNLECSLFQVLQGAPLGTLTYAFRTESYAAAVASSDALIASDDYLQRVESGAQYYVGNPEDRLAQFLHIAGSVSGPPPAAFVVNAQIDVSRAKEAIAWSVELADYLNNATAVPTAVLLSNFGAYGTISWISYGSSLAQLEQTGQKTNADPGFLQRLGESGGLFVPGSGVGLLSRKIA